MSRPPDKFRARLKLLLGIKRDTSGSLSPQLPPVAVEVPVECDELLKEVGPESGNNQSSRARMLKELCEVVAAKQLEEHAVEALWLAVKDLLQAENPADVRQITLQFLTSLVTGQYGSLKLLRAHFFMVIQDHNIPEDLTHRLHFLKALTLDGTDILSFEEQIGPFLLSLMSISAVSGEKLDLFLPLLRNFIRYNSSYLDEDVVSSLVKHTCQIATTTEKEDDVEHSLAILDAVIRYSSLPSSALYSFLIAVCNTVNVKKFCEPSWRLMRHLLGTHLGHNGVLTMCCILEDSNNWNKFPLLRGAIFFVGMCLWGSKRVRSLLHKPIAVLPSFYKVLSCDNESVICEVALSMQRLVKKYGMHQHDVAWESILDITAALHEYVERHPSCTTVVENFHVLLSCIEELHEKHEFHGSADKLFAIVGKCTKQRPDSSVILLVSHRAQSLHPYCDNWFENIKDLVEKYFKYEERTAIRIKVLDVLYNILGTFSPLYEEEILENSVLPYLDSIAKDRDIDVRVRAVQLLVDVIEGSDSQKVSDVLNIVEKIAYCSVDPLKRYVRPSQHGTNKDQPQDENVLKDIKEAVFGLVRLFKVKLFRKPEGQAERIFNILVSHIKSHYDNGYRTYIASQIRLAILKCFLSLRADSCHRLGIVQENGSEVKFSSYFACAERKSSSDDKTSGLVSLPYSEAMNVILMCLQQELEWEVLDVVLEVIPETLQDKHLILSGKQYLNSICTVLSKMVSNYDFLPGLFRVPHEMRRPHLYARIFPVLTELCTYHAYIGQDEQFCLMHTMEIGLVAHSAALCVSCLTICMLEIPSVMARLLPTYLEKFAKLSPTPQVAIPLLEFLSALSHFRELYTNFTAVQFKQVFAICLPYTDSARYSPYTVTLAHNVICSWYVHCPLVLRRQFVSFITKSLRQTEMSPKTSTPYPKVPTSPNKLQPPPASPEKTSEDPSNALSSEMVEVAVDMMVKYTFSSSLTQPKRTAVVEQLLANGTSRSWLLGNVLVTVTVSQRTPSNLPCPYCSTGKASVSQTLPRTRTDSLLHSGTGAHSVTPDIRIGEKTSHENESSAGMKLQAPFEKDTTTYLDVPMDQPFNTNIPTQQQPSPNLLSTVPPTTEPQTGRSNGSQEQPRDSSDECGCVCQAWAEFLVRRPTGNTSWILRLQNRPKLDGGFSQASHPVVEQTSPQIYESLIPKQFFDDLSAELKQEQSRIHLAKTAGLLSKSADSDTLVVDLIRDRLTSELDRVERFVDGASIMVEKKDPGNCLTTQKDEGNPEIEVQQEAEKDVRVDDMEVQSTGNTEQRVSFTEDKDVKTSPSTSITSQDSDSKLSLGSSFMERTRLLSRSPMDGPSAFMLLDRSGGSKVNVLLEDEADRNNEDLSTQEDFQKPVVGKSPLDASPLKTFLHQDSCEQNESDDETSQNSEDEDTSPSPEDHSTEPTPSLVPINVCENPDMNDVTSPESATSLPFSRAQSPPNGLGRCHRISESSGGSISLPTTPLTSRTKSPEFFFAKAVGKKSRNGYGRRTVSPVANIPGRTTPTTKVPEVKVQNKSATVDLGMLRRASSSPEIDEPVKEKRGLMKFFDNVGESKEKKQPVVLRRQTMSCTQLPRKKVNRRSYNGPFPDSVTKGGEHVSEDVSSTYDAMSPSFIFLQFYHSSWFSENDIPLALPEQEFYHRAVKNLDRIPPYDTHKIGVIYVGPDQGDDEVSILRNQYGSSRYMEFLSGLGELVRLRDQSSLCEVYTGGLERNGADGEFAYSWRSEIAQVIFHIATLMPNKEKDPNCHSKKLHIGNDFVTIVYNDSNTAYTMGTIKGQFNFVEVVVKPLENESNVLSLNIKDELKDILVNTNCGPRIISDKNLPTLVRHMALHVNMASVIHQSQKTPTDAYGCNWLQRLRQIKRIQSRIPSVETDAEGAALISTKNIHNIVDFTKYILQ